MEPVQMLKTFTWKQQIVMFTWFKDYGETDNGLEGKKPYYCTLLKQSKGSELNDGHWNRDTNALGEVLNDYLMFPKCCNKPAKYWDGEMHGSCRHFLYTLNPNHLLLWCWPWDPYHVQLRNSSLSSELSSRSSWLEPSSSSSSSSSSSRISPSAAQTLWRMQHTPVTLGANRGWIPTTLRKMIASRHAKDTLEMMLLSMAKCLL